MTPNSRLARHLRWHAGIERQRAGESAWQTPDILSLRKWLERCWEQSLVSGGAAGQRVLLNAGQFRHVSRGIFAELAAGRSLSAGVERLVREARDVAGYWQIGVHDLRAVASGPDAGFYAAWAEHFAAICRERSWVDAAGLAELLLPELGTGSIRVRQKIILAGFEYPNAVEAKLFDRLDELDLLAGRIAPPTFDKVVGRRIDCDDPAAERRAAAQWARTRFEERKDSLIGIIVPDLNHSVDAYRRSFLDAFDPVWRDRDDTLFPVTVANSMKLADAELARTAQLLLRVPEGRLDYREVGQLLRSPYVGGWDAEAAERARFDLRIRDGGLQQINLRSMRKQFCQSDDAGPQVFLSIIDALLQQTEAARKRRDPGNWVEWFEAVLLAAQFCQGRELSQRDEATYDDWRRSIERFASLSEVTGRVGYRQALGLLREALQEQPLYRHGRDDGIHIIKLNEATGMRFDALWLCGMTSAAWPGEPRPSPLIPLSLQRARGIPEAVPTLYRERALRGLGTLFASAPECISSWPEYDGEETLVSSPHIASLTPATPDQVGVDMTAVNYRELQLCGERTSTADDPAPPVGENEKTRGGSRILNLQSICPARAFFELRLGAAELVTPPFALDAATRGKLAHDAAEYFYAALRANDGPLAAVETVLEQEATAAITRSLDRHIPPIHPLADTLRETERARLKRLLHHLIERDRRRGQINIVELENRHQIEIDGLILTVRFDRVDRSDDSALLVIDYKTGIKFSKSKWLGERPLDMQLPLYAAYSHTDGIALYWLHANELSITGMGAEDWGINNGLSGRSKAFHVLEPAEWQQQLHTWRDICQGLIGEFRRGDCRIDIVTESLATGEYAMLTRRWALAPTDEEAG